MVATEQLSGNSKQITYPDLTGFQRDALWVIAGHESGDNELHGLAIKDELEEYYETEIHHGRLYPNLDDLVQNGLVEKDQLDGRTNCYELTDYGVQTLLARRTRVNKLLEEQDE